MKALASMAMTSSIYKCLAAEAASSVCGVFADQLRALPPASVEKGKSFSSHLRARVADPVADTWFVWDETDWFEKQRADAEDPSAEIGDFEFFAELRLDPLTDVPSFVALSVSDERRIQVGDDDPNVIVSLATRRMTLLEYDTSKRAGAPIRVWCRRRCAPGVARMGPALRSTACRSRRTWSGTR